MKMNLFLVFIMLLMPICSAEQTRISAWHKVDQNVPRVSVINLIDAPDLYDGKEVYVLGYLSFGIENSTMCSSAGFGERGDCIWLEVHSSKDNENENENENDNATDILYFSKKAKMEKFVGKLIYVRGTFSHQKSGHFGLYPSVISNVTEVFGNNPHYILNDDEENMAQPTSNMDGQSDAKDLMSSHCWMTPVKGMELSKGKPHEQQETLVVSVKELINLPERYHEKPVLVNGYVLGESDAFARELPALCQSETLTSFQDCIWLATVGEVGSFNHERAEHLRENYEKCGHDIIGIFGGKRAFVRGVFDSRDKGWLGIYGGSVKNIIEIFGESTPLIFDVQSASKAGK
ncbi:hypothetical protein AGMMS49960_20010 [Betaproteobacteria bacterium]|nr:hypothetical protein AGMMS49543_24000 [Betaproteobacteria bacterium]GHU04385.1 hypothetical protein AGMMS49960_20010 [Betaproteobacteria bacterium]GHU23517.1 hypothetical protein AGMMS50243_25060 [Betaproteobacteria bacterium]